MLGQKENHKVIIARAYRASQHDRWWQQVLGDKTEAMRLERSEMKQLKERDLFKEVLKNGNIFLKCVHVC